MKNREGRGEEKNCLSNAFAYFFIFSKSPVVPRPSIFCAWRFVLRLFSHPQSFVLSFLLFYKKKKIAMEAGDVIFVVNELPHASFRRDQADLFIKR